MQDFTVTKARFGGFVVTDPGAPEYTPRIPLFAGDAEAVLAFIANDLRAAVFAIRPTSQPPSGEVVG